MKKYHSVRPMQEPTYKRDKNKMEASVKPEDAGQVQYAEKKKKKINPNPYE